MNHENLKLEVGNHLREQLPLAVPGLTKQAYEEIINDAVNALPIELMKQAEAFEAFEAPLEKEAAFGANVAKGAAEALGKGAVGLGVAAVGGAALYGVRKALEGKARNDLHPAFTNALQIAIQSPDRSGEILRSHDRKKVVSFAETIFNYAPHVATDPNLLKSVLAEAVYGDAISPGTIKALMELEEKKKNLSSWKPADILARG